VVRLKDPIGPSAIVRVADNAEIMVCAEWVVHRFGLSGFFGFDFMIEDGSGAAYLIEMNSRGTPLRHLQLGKGRDMVDALWAQPSNQPLQETPPVAQNDMVAYFPGAWHCKSEFFESSYQDIPHGEPDLVREILYPCPDRSLLAQANIQLWNTWLYFTSAKAPISS
jgi:hypothetical protein